MRINIDDDIYYEEVKKYLRKNYKKLSLYESGVVKMIFEDENMNKEDVSYLTLLEKYITKLSEENKNKCREIFSKNIEIDLREKLAHLGLDEIKSFTFRSTVFFIKCLSKFNFSSI